MTGADLIRLAEDLAECGGVHRATNCIAAAVHVLLEHERRAARSVERWEDGPEVGCGMSDKAISPPRCTEYLREHGQGYRWPCDRCGAGPCRAGAGSGAPAGEGDAGGVGCPGTDRGASTGFQAPLVTCPVCRVTAAAFVCSIWGCPVNGGAAYPEPGLRNPAPLSPERGERMPVPCGGISHGAGSPVAERHSGPSDMAKRLVPRNSAAELGDCA